MKCKHRDSSRMLLTPGTRGESIRYVGSKGIIPRPPEAYLNRDDPTRIYIELN